MLKQSKTGNNLSKNQNLNINKMTEQKNLIVEHFKTKSVKVIYRGCKNELRKAFGFLKFFCDNFLIIENSELGDIGINISDINVISENKKRD